jgi:hypothetical protein
MELNAVETFLKTNGGFASKRVLQKQLKMSKKQVRRLIMNSMNLKAINPLRVGSGKNYLSIFEYSPESNDGISYFKRRRNQYRMKKNVTESE